MNGFPIEKLVNYNETKFNSLEITENKFDDEYEYNLNYDISVKFKDLNTTNKRFDRLSTDNAFRKKGFESYKYDKRPQIMNKIIAPEDDKEGTQNYAIRDFVDDLSITQQLQMCWEIFHVNIPLEVYNDAVYNSKIEFSNKRHLTDVEFDYRKPKVSTLVLKYDTGESFAVQLPHTVTNKEVDEVIPDMILPTIYNNISDWLEEDYEGTLEILKEIFKIDFETLKGAEIK